MRLTRIRRNGKKLTETEMADLIKKLDKAILEKHFETDVFRVNSSRIDIKKQHESKHFTVNQHALGYNARVSRWSTPIKGYTRTNLPTWAQRVEFNNVVNMVLNEENISCKVVSGPFVIRYGQKNYDRKDWAYQQPSWYSNNVYELTQEMIENGKELEREHRRQRYQENKRKNTKVAKALWT